MAPNTWLRQFYQLIQINLRWSKDVRYRAAIVRACADGGDERAKGKFAALGMLLYCSLLLSRQQIIEKSIDTGDLILDPSDPAYSHDVMEVINKIINFVARDSAPDFIKRLAKLSRDTTTCVRSRGESMSTYIERFSLPVQTYLNLTNSYRASAERKPELSDDPYFE